MNTKLTTHQGPLIAGVALIAGSLIAALSVTATHAGANPTLPTNVIRPSHIDPALVALAANAPTDISIPDDGQPNYTRPSYIDPTLAALAAAAADTSIPDNGRATTMFAKPGGIRPDYIDPALTALAARLDVDSLDTVFSAYVPVAEDQVRTENAEACEHGNDAAAAQLLGMVDSSVPPSERWPG